MFEVKTVKLLMAGGLAAAALMPAPALAYMGAGAGLSAIGSALSFIGVFALMLLGFIWYPVKRMLRRGKDETASETPADGEVSAKSDASGE